MAAIIIIAVQALEKRTAELKQKETQIATLQSEVQDLKLGMPILRLWRRGWRISKTSPARLTLAKAREIDTHPSSKLTNKWVIVCDRFNAAALRNAAQEHCPEALPEIEAAFKHDRFYWSQPILCATN